MGLVWLPAPLKTTLALALLFATITNNLIETRHQHPTKINVQFMNATSDQSLLLTSPLSLSAPPPSLSLQLSPSAEKFSAINQQDQADAPSLDLRPPSLIRLDSKAKNDTITVSWSMPKTDIPITDFLIRYGLKTPEEQTAIVKSNLRQFTINGLYPDTDYLISMRARNNGNEGQPKYDYIRTLRTEDMENLDFNKAHSKLSAPMGLKAETVSPTSVALSWSEASAYKLSNGIVRMAMVRYYINTQSTTNHISYMYKNTTITQNKLILDDLKPHTEYGFAVKILISPDGVRFIRDSGWSMDAHTRTYEGEPTAPRDLNLQNVITEFGLADATKVELQWSPPESVNGELKGYSIFYSSDPLADNWPKIDVNGDVNTFVVKDLLTDVKYYFKVRARNNRNSGPFTDVKTYQVPSTATLIHTPTAIPNSFIILTAALVTIVVSIILAITFALLAYNSRKSSKPIATLSTTIQQGHPTQGTKSNGIYGTTASVNRMATLGRARRDTRPPDLWINQDQVDAKSTISEKSPSEMNIAMVSVKRDSPKFTTQLAGNADLRFQAQNSNLSHYQTSPPQSDYIYYDENDHLGGMHSLGKRQQQQQLQQQQQQQQRMQLPPPPSQLQSNSNLNQLQPMIMSPHQQPPPPPPLNIEQQSQLYSGANLHNTRSLRINRPLLYDPVAGSFAQGDISTYGTHNPHHHISTLSRRSSTNTLRSFQTYHSQMMPTIPPQAPTTHLLQSHQAVINQLNSAPYPSLPLKHVSAVRPQIMSNTQDTLDMTIEEKETIKQ